MTRSIGIVVKHEGLGGGRHSFERNSSKLKCITVTFGIIYVLNVPNLVGRG